MYDSNMTREERAAEAKEKLYEKLSETLDSLNQNLGRLTELTIESNAFNMRKEILVRSDALFAKLNEISEFLKDCKTQNIQINTNELDQIHFRTYSLSKLKEDVSRYFELVKGFQNTNNPEKTMWQLEVERARIVDNIPRFLSPYFEYLFPTKVVYEYHEYFEDGDYKALITSGLKAPLTDVEGNILKDNKSPLNYVNFLGEYRLYDFKNNSFKLSDEAISIPENIKLLNPSHAYVDEDKKDIRLDIILNGTLYRGIDATSLESTIKKIYEGNPEKAEQIISLYQDQVFPYSNPNVLKEYISYMKNNADDFEEIPEVKNFNARYLDYIIDSYNVYATALVNMKRQALNAMDEKSLNFTPCAKK